MVAEDGGGRWRCRCLLSQFEEEFGVEFGVKFGEFEGEEGLASVRESELVLAAGEPAGERDEFLLEVPVSTRGFPAERLLFREQVLAKR